MSVNGVKANIVCFNMASEERKVASTSAKAASALTGGVQKEHQFQPSSGKDDKSGCAWPDLRPTLHHVLPPDTANCDTWRDM